VVSDVVGKSGRAVPEALIAGERDPLVLAELAMARYRRLASRRGKKRALVALEHTILVAVRHMSTNDTDYRDLGGRRVRSGTHTPLVAKSRTGRPPGRHWALPSPPPTSRPCRSRQMRRIT
jgi:hypothetical protein